MSIGFASAMALVSTVLFGISTVMLKVGVARGAPELTMKKVLRQPIAVTVALLKNPIWTLGMIMQSIGGVLYLAALARLDITIVKPVVTFYVVVSAVLGVVFLRERLTRWENAGIVISVLGALLLAAFGEAATGTVGAGAGGEPAMWGILAADGLVCCGLGAWLFSSRRPWFASREVVLSLIAGLNWGVGSVYWKILYAEATAPVDVASGWIGVTLALLVSPALWLTMVLNALAFVVYLVAFAGGRVAVVAPTVMIATLAGPLAAGSFVFGEALPPLKLLGIVGAVAGTALLAMAQPGDDASPTPSGGGIEERSSEAA